MIALKYTKSPKTNIDAQNKYNRYKADLLGEQ